jgi:endonuclease III
VQREERVVAVLRRLTLDTRAGRYRSAPVYQGPFEGHDGVRAPFLELVSCLVSQRVRDQQTIRICAELFRWASTPEELARLPLSRLERILHPAGFYHQKARQLRALAREVLARGGVPRTRDGLMSLTGIGPKCANLVLANCFGKPQIAVDTHVHRISNRMDWVRTTTPEATEAKLTPIVPTRWRRRVNVLLVAHGQLVCRPVGPRCGECAVSEWCRRRSVVARAEA